MGFVEGFRLKKDHIKILDAGCGTGLLAKKLEEYGDVTGLDFSNEALKYARRRGIKTVHGSVVKLPFKANTYDLVTSIDVIYHNSIKEDQVALNELYRVLKEGGHLILRVPANKWLHTSHDAHVHTRERYNKIELYRKLRGTGFDVKRLTFMQFALLPLAFIKQLLEGSLSSDIKSGVERVNPLVNSFLEFILTIENFLILKGLNLPAGLGLIAVCQKPKNV